MHNTVENKKEKYCNRRITKKQFFSIRKTLENLYMLWGLIGKRGDYQGIIVQPIWKNSTRGMEIVKGD